MTIFATALAATTSVMAWRLARREARRSEARVAALASAIYGPDGPVSAETAMAIASFPSEYPAVSATSAARLTGYRAVAMASAAALVVALLIVAAARGGGAPVAGAEVSETSANPAPSTRSSAQTAAEAPLELIALSHERAKDALIVRGAIRNPPNGTTCEMPAVVVLAFDDRGVFLGSSQVEASGESLAPGAQATFSVKVAAKTTPPARYKVSFRRMGALVPHVDRRVPDAAAGRIDAAPPRPAARTGAAAVQS
jgi:hypothetical protein